MAMRLSVIAVIAICFAAKAGAHSGDPAPSCTTMTTCLEQFHALDPGTDDNGGLDGAQQALSAGLESLSPAPIVTLIQLLDDPGVKRRNVAAHALGALKAREAVPALMRHVGDTSWADWALASIGDARAILAMLKQLGDLHGGGDAIARFGSVGVAALAKVLVDPHASVVAQHGAMSGMTSHSVDDDVDVSEAVAILRRAIPVTDERLDWIVIVLASFGPRAAAAIPELRALRGTSAVARVERTVQLGQGATSTSSMPDIDIVLVRLGDAEPVRRVAEQLRSEERWAFYASLDALSSLGPRAVSAVPPLTDLLRHGTFKQQAVAARLLGSIGDPSTTKELVAAFDVRSWRVAGEAARALGQLGEAAGVDAATALAALRDTHWSAVVRDIANVAYRQTCGEHIDVAQTEEAWGSLDRGFETDVRHGGITCAFARVDGGSTRWKARLDGRWFELQNLFDGPPLPTPLPGELTPRYGSGQIFVSGDSTFVARHGGEWEGDLHVVEGGVATRLANRNTSGLVHIGADVFAVGGLAHLGMNEGMVTRVRRVDGHWQARELVELPGDPRALAVVDGRLVVGILGPETLVIDVDGTVHAVPCSIVGPQ